MNDVIFWSVWAGLALVMILYYFRRKHPIRSMLTGTIGCAVSGALRRASLRVYAGAECAASVAVGDLGNPRCDSYDCAALCNLIQKRLFQIRNRRF